MGKYSIFVVASLILGALAPEPSFAADGDESPRGEPQQVDSTERGDSTNAGEQPGRADLDTATQTKLTATSAQHLAKVIELGESAIRKGLDEANAAIAKQLVVGTRFERASVFSSMIFERRRPDQRWTQYRDLAISDLDKALQHDSEHVQCLMLLGRLYSLPGIEGNRDKAIGVFDKVIQLSEDDKPQKSEVLAYRAAAQVDTKKRDADLDASIALDPKNLDAIRARAMVLVDAREYKKAIADLETALQLDPQNPRMYEVMAVTLLALGKTDDAIEKLNTAIKLAPENPSALAQRSRLYFIEKKYKLAVADSAAAIKLAPRNPAVQLLHAANLQQAGQPKAALKVVNGLLVVNPNLERAIEVKASLLAEMGRFEEAIADVEKAVERDPDNLQLISTLGSLYAVNKQTEKAIEMFDRLLESDIAVGPAFATVYRSRADAMLSLGRQAEAMADYKKALELAPDNEGIMNNLAWLMATSPDTELRNGKKALELATKACQVSDYKKAYILSTLAAAHAEAGDFAKAIEWAQKAVELSDEDVADQLKAELESYRRSEPWREKQSPDDKEEASKDASEESSNGPPTKDEAVDGDESSSNESPAKDDDDSAEDTFEPPK